MEQNKKKSKEQLPAQSNSELFDLQYCNVLRELFVRTQFSSTNV